MDLFDLIKPSCVRAQLKAGSKKTLLQQLAAVAARDTGLDERRIAEALLARERLGTTGLGGGVAVPHARLPDVKRVTGVFAKLDPAVDFDALDRRNVDLAFMLLSPEDAGADHLKALAMVTRLFRDKTLVEKLRGTNSADAMCALLSRVDHSQAA